MTLLLGDLMFKKIGIIFIIIIFTLSGFGLGLFGNKSLNLVKLLNLNNPTNQITEKENVKVLNEESVVIDVVEKASPSVVTVSISKNQKVIDWGNGNMLDPFGLFNQPQPSSQSQKIEQDIGSGFIISKDGLIVTNKHVVSDTEAKYKVITKDDKTYDVEKIYRDPANDLAILQINASNLKPLEFGDSGKLKVGQFVITIGTALGEFRNTVTTGVVSGLGRGITAGSPFEGMSEKLDNVIQTDAAINPGNSGGPLLNSGGQAIGINVAVSSEGQNIGFALPINIIKESLNNFNQTGKFSRPFLGVRYQIVTRKLALINEIPEGAYIEEVVAGSPAEKAGLVQGDIITKIDGKAVRETDGGLSAIISKKKPGDRVSLEVYKTNEKTEKIEVILDENSGE